MFNYQGGYEAYDEGFASKAPQGVYEESVTQKALVGTVRRIADRTFVYTKNGGTGLDRGKITIQPTPAANHQNVAVPAALVAGLDYITVTLGATLASVNQYENGYIFITDVDSEGVGYRVRSHPAANSGASLKLTLWDKITTALTTDSQCCLIPNQYNGVVISINDQKDIPAGVPLIGITDSYYFWLQTGGPCAVWADEIIAQGLEVTLGSSVGGSVEGRDAAGEPLVGIAIIAAVDDEYRPIYLKIKE